MKFIILFYRHKIDEVNVRYCISWEIESISPIYWITSVCELINEKWTHFNHLRVEIDRNNSLIQLINNILIN